MDKKRIADFFDSYASSWDDSMQIREDVISDILDLARIGENSEVLDVASGTGVLFPFYKRLGASVTGIDISAEMVRLAKEKFPETEIICADVENYNFNKQFDVIMIHNAFPHFPDGKQLISYLSAFLKQEGRLVVAHSMSEAELESCHSGAAKEVSLPLPSKEELSALMEPFLKADIAVSDDRMYFVSGIKKQ